MRPLIVSLTLLLLGACDLGEYDPSNPGGGGGTGARYHPLGWAASSAHGPDLNLGGQDCRNCHGTDLAGDIAAPSCDTCHTPETPKAWRSDCVFCHGGVNDASGAPPGDLDGSPMDLSFGAHTAHLESAMMAASCSDCHVEPGDVLTPNHVFDDTAGIAEVVFAATLNPGATYAVTAANSCDNIYCHGNGRQSGTVLASAGPMACSSCHADRPNTGSHNDHRGDPCSDCHNDTTKDDVTIANLALHVDGLRQIVINNPGGLTFTVNNGEVRCSGRCHGQGRDHENDRW